jgi:hypothetical protein
MAASGWMIRILAFTWPELADADLVDGGIAYFPLLILQALRPKALSRSMASIRLMSG